MKYFYSKLYFDKQFINFCQPKPEALDNPEKILGIYQNI